MSENAGRWRVPLTLGAWHRFVPQPRFLRRWYYRSSIRWWGHPSNHHWKLFIMGPAEGQENIGPILGAGERDLWSGMYCSGQQERCG